MFHIVQPCANGPRRFEHGTLISSHRTADEAFDELERLTAVLGPHGISGPALDLVVVSDDHSPVPSARQISRRHSAMWTGSTQPEASAAGDDAVTGTPRGALIDGWEAVDGRPTPRAALVPLGDRGVQVWWMDERGSSSRVPQAEEDLKRAPRVVRPAPPECGAASDTDVRSPAARALRRWSSQPERPRTFWSSCQVRVRWPTNIGADWHA